ncbi:MAG TPA: hypothetical protein VFU41_07260 [Gemmatimonadales bacterium]|nr:hypothetical protein [Gemmatimonadales bacterium]
MRRFLLCVGLALLATIAPPPARAAAQQGAEANLVLTLLGGVVGGADLWTIDRQAYCAVFSNGGCAAPYDTLGLARAMTSSLAIGAGMTYFPGPRFGFQAEIAYVGLPLNDDCRVLNASPTPPTPEVCADIRRASQTTGAVSFTASTLLRASPRGTLSPFVRGGLGLIVYNHSTIEVWGEDGTGAAYQVIRDDDPRRLAASLVLGVGATVALGSGYQLRLEGRDVIAGFERVTGSADNLGNPPVGTRYNHHFALSIGLDVVLERKRGRRY